MSDEAKLKQNLRDKAIKDLNVWYERRTAEIEKQKSKNRSAEANEPDDRTGQSVDQSTKYVSVFLDYLFTLVVGREWLIS